MDPALLQAASVMWAALSAIAVVALGIFALTGGRSRAPGSLAFGGFAIVWGVHVLAGRWMAYADLADAPRAHLTYLALLLPLPYLVLNFARAHSSRAAGTAWRVASAVAIGAALLAAGLLLFAPSLLYEGARPLNGTAFPRWGPLFAPLVMFPFFGALGVALLALDGARRAAATARAAQGAALLAAGIGLFTAFAAGNNAAFYGADALTYGVHGLARAYVGLFLALGLASIYVGARAVHDARRAPSPRLRAFAVWVAVATLVPLSWGFVEGLLAYAVFTRLDTAGLWRLGSVALLAFALARSRMPDLAPRSRQSAATIVGIAAAATTGGLGVGFLLLVAPPSPFTFLAAVALPLATLSPSVQLARRALRVPAAPDLTDATLARRVETYRAALEGSLARGSLDEDVAFLEALRARLGLTPDVHAALLCIARASVLAPPDASHPGYERLRLLGEGAHGRAWLARRRADDELVVIKEPREHTPAARATNHQQARLAQRVRHPHLVHTHGVVDTAHGSFLVMDHVPGGSLADLLAKGPLPSQTASRLALEVLSGLAALHEAGVVHGDIKPANVLLDEGARARIADFGLARPHDPHATLTMTGPRGTLSAMAPEQLEGATATPATDVYAMGALLYRLLTGEHYVAFDGVDEARAHALVRDAPARLPHPRVPPSIERVIRRALAKRPEERYPDAAAMRAALEGSDL